MKKRPHAKPKLTLEERFVSAGFAAFFGAFAAVLFSLFYFRGVNVGAGIGLLGFLGWFAGGFALVGFLVGPAVADLIGSLGLVLKRRWATPLLILSVLGLVVQDLGFVLIARTLPIPTAGWIMQGLVLVIAILLVVMARKAARHGWLR